MLVMKLKKLKQNNNGFSLVELIVVIAIMSIAVGALSLSMSLVTGAEAKKAFSKIESVIDEARTGSMTRFNETLTIKYAPKNTEVGVGGVVSGKIEDNGYYGVLTMYALKAQMAPGESDLKHPLVDTAGYEVTNKETRKLCNATPELAIVCESGGAETKYPIGADNSSLDDNSSFIKFEFDRSTGLYKKITIKGSAGTTVINYDNVSRKFGIEGGADDVNVFITARSGMRTYKMQLIGETGKHIRIE